VENPLGGGTVIHPNPEESTLGELVSLTPEKILTFHAQSLANPQSTKTRRLPTAVTIKENIVVLSVNSNRKAISHGFLAKIFGTLDKFGVVVDLISTSEVHVSLAIENTLEKRLFTRLVCELEKSGTVRCPLDLDHLLSSSYNLASDRGPLYEIAHRVIFFTTLVFFRIAPMAHIFCHRFLSIRGWQFFLSSASK
jgi:aspartokinase